MSTPLGYRGKFHSGQPAATDQFREVTANQVAMPGVTSPSFFCRCCKKTKLTRGRKPILPGSSRAGYKCADCANKHSA